MSINQSINQNIKVSRCHVVNRCTFTDTICW